MNIQKGLKGVVVTETQIGEVDGTEGKLIYRGYDVRDIASSYTFEEIAHLIWYGEFPTIEQLDQTDFMFKKYRKLTPVMEKVLTSLPENMTAMSVLRTVLSAAGDDTFINKPSIEEAIKLTAVIPTIIAYRFRLLEGKVVVPPSKDLSHVENYLYMLNGEKEAEELVRVLETYMNLTMEHGMNASTFAARVTASTESDMVSSITSAIGTMKGPLHGGAPSEVINLLDELSLVDNLEEHLRAKVQSGQKLMGFGHRVYKTIDPRSVAIKNLLISLVGKDEWLDLALKVEQLALKVLQEEKPGRSLYTNVEFFAAAIMKAISLDPSLFTPTFSASRMVGWTAHIMEQAEDNVIIRPLSKYIGK
ncbi:citrate synthase/methylcitrate synthase [Sutcliffiella rhizosphaerae]|uniref:Citrate synthase n=1 Tax=Sutcliffiella rhizosphaerae TaxID=2880967 RepID=A0ABN8ABS3_9BACI|nr:citrate synthase/methylcitrate synthase [Sutcliffiella rhizosphaerae]CAG9621641.1 Citrate synthase 1 [Sutcliffiella rhizosphaerae]